MSLVKLKGKNRDDHHFPHPQTWPCATSVYIYTINIYITTKFFFPLAVYLKQGVGATSVVSSGDLHWSVIVTIF